MVADLQTSVSHLLPTPGNATLLDINDSEHVNYDENVSSYVVPVLFTLTDLSSHLTSNESLNRQKEPMISIWPLWPVVPKQPC